MDNNQIDGGTCGVVSTPVPVLPSWALIALLLLLALAGFTMMRRLES